jgi:hypothetical protein
MSPHWSDEQIENMEEAGQFSYAFGIILDNHIVIDIDVRHGGDIEQIPQEWVDQCNFIVRTGGGGWHLYYKIPEDFNKSLRAHLPEYPGIDFKSNGFVIGCGSLHKSGGEYESLKGHLCDIGAAPSSLLSSLERDDTFRCDHDGVNIDVSIDDIVDMLKYYKNTNLEYDEWISVGMIIHQATGGNGYQLWEDWSSTSDKHNSSGMMNKWRSFGQCANPVTIGTLIYHAEKNGYKKPITFTATEAQEDENNMLDVSHIDLLRPPGFVGDIVQWVNSQCEFPRERLAVASTLATLGTICGLTYHGDDKHKTTTNLFVFCVAGSSSGKEAVLQASFKLMKAAGMAKVVCGKIKSEQEIGRNLLDHQACFFMIDELGILLRKLDNAQKKGGSSYLEGVIGELMNIYSKANGTLPLSGDIKKEFVRVAQDELNRSQKKVDENEDKSGYHARKVEIYAELLASCQDGSIEKPFLSMVGYTTPTTFDDCMTYEQATNGFLGRAIIAREANSNPYPKQNWQPQPLHEGLIMGLKQLANAGDTSKYDIRVQNYNDLKVIESTQDAIKAFQNIRIELIDYADTELIRSKNLQPLVRRAPEMISKVSFILAAPSGLRTVEHVLWAYAYAKRDIETKIEYINASIEEEHESGQDALFSKIKKLLDDEEGQTLGYIAHSCRQYKKEDVNKALAIFIDKGVVRTEKTKGGRGKGRPTTLYFKNNH